MLQNKHSLLIDDLIYENDEIDYFLMDKIRAEQYVMRYPEDFIISSNYLSKDQIGITCRKDDGILVNSLNVAIKTLQEDGTLSKGLEKICHQI